MILDIYILNPQLEINSAIYAIFVIFLAVALFFSISISFGHKKDQSEKKENRLNKLGIRLSGLIKKENLRASQAK